MRKQIAIVAAALCIAVQPVMAQTDAKAKSVLDAVSKKISSLKSFKASFTLNLTGGKNVTDSKKGTLTVKGEKYHVLIAGQEIISDNKTVWTYNKDAKEVQVSNFVPSEQSMSPAKLLTNFWDKEYKYTYKGERKQQGKNCDVVELVPTDKNKKLSRIELLVDKASSTIVGGNYWEKNGNKYEVAVTNFTPNATVTDNYFTWNPKEHAGVELVDLR